MSRLWLRRTLLVAYTGLFLAFAYFAADRTQWYGFILAACTLFLILCTLRGALIPSTGVIVGLAILFRAFVFPLPPVLSDDVYRYIWDGRLLTEGINPFEHTPEDPYLEPYQSEPIFDELNSSTYHTVYPPVSQLIFGAGALPYDAGWQVSLYTIKLILALFEIAVLLLLARMVPPPVLILYAWHPLVVLETAGQAHTEAPMLLFMLLALWFSEKNRAGWASVMLACAGWVKLYPFVFFPFLIRRHGMKSTVPGIVAAVVIAAPFYHPSFLGNIRESLELYVRFFEFNAGFYYGVKKIYLIATGDDWSKILGPAFRRFFVLALPVLYALDWKLRWPLWKAFLITIATFLVLSTTVHPWYLLGLLLLAAVSQKPHWHWQWLGALTIGTYLLYIDGPYWWFVNIAWIGWLGLLLMQHRAQPMRWLQALQRFRGRMKAQRIAPYLPVQTEPLKVLDLGAGEGYVGHTLYKRYGLHVMLADIVNMNRTWLPLIQYDGRTLPLADAQVDATVLYFVLHHAEHPEQVLQEALRVSSRRVIIVESVYESRWDLLVLRNLDILANRLRSFHAMRDQEQHLRFRTVRAWKDLFETAHIQVMADRPYGSWPHKQHLFVLDASTSRTP